MFKVNILNRKFGGKLRISNTLEFEDRRKAVNYCVAYNVLHNVEAVGHNWYSKAKCDFITFDIEMEYLKAKMDNFLYLELFSIIQRGSELAIKPDITFESKLSDIKDIEERNKVFYELSNEDKRKEIAWDCLNLLISGKVSAANGYYWSNSLKSIHKPIAKEFQEYLNNELPECEVCAKGGMMLSQIRLGYKLSSNTTGIAEGMPGILQGFNMLSLDKMEVEFEFSRFKHPYARHTNEKLANICCNVIMNGDFNHLDKTDYLL